LDRAYLVDSTLFACRWTTRRPPTCEQNQRKHIRVTQNRRRMAIQLNSPILKQKSSQRPHIRPPRRIRTASRVRIGIYAIRIRTRDRDYFQNLTGTFLSNITSVIKIPWKSGHSLRRY